MSAKELLERARRAAGLTQDELARRAGTSRPTLSAYEHGHKSPSLDTASRVLAAAGRQLSSEPLVTFTRHPVRPGRFVSVPDHLPRLPVEKAFATVVLPLHLDWSDPGRTVRLADRRQRARAYEVVLREGTEADIRAYVDGALLVDLWDDLVLPKVIRDAWAPVLQSAVTP